MENKRKPNSLVYALSEEDVPSTFFTSHLLVANTSACKLIDSSASHSFVATKVVDKLGWNKEIFSQPFIQLTLSRY